MSRITKLNILDFSPGIRAIYINENFELIKRWIEEERLRVSGWGIVEGFEMSDEMPDSYVINVDKGIIILKNGEEVEIPKHSFDGLELDPEYGLRPRPIYAEEVLTAVAATDEKNGEIATITVQNKIYSEDETTANGRFKNSIVYTGDQVLPNDVEIRYYDTGNLVPTTKIRSIEGNKINFTKDLKGLKIRVNYKYAGSDRMDGVFVHQDGSIYEDTKLYMRYSKGIGSETPTCDKESEYIVGYVYWHVDKTLEVEFITVDRQYRQVYVDKNGQLYLMGKPYTGYKYILFEEQARLYDGDYVELLGYPPSNASPVPFDLWYDVDENILKIWRKDVVLDKYGWYPVNDLSRFTRDYERFDLEHNPKNLKTFLFSGGKDMKFVPGKHQLTIIIDQVVVMEDQYRELYIDDPEEHQATGYGFELYDPLDEPKIVEVYVSHSVNNQNCEEDMFSKVGCFVENGSIGITDSNKNTIFHPIEAEYELNQNQLEIWLNGVKLLIDRDFYEAYVDPETNTLTQANHGSNSAEVGLGVAFKINKALKVGDVLEYKVTRFMYAYSNFKLVMDKVKERITTLEQTTPAEIEDIRDIINRHKGDNNAYIEKTDERLDYLEENVREKKDPITQVDLDSSLEEKIKHSINIYNNISTYDPDPIFGKVSDFYHVIYVEGDTRTVLARNLDYDVVDAGVPNQVRINTKSSTWRNENAKLYVERISLFDR